MRILQQLRLRVELFVTASYVSNPFGMAAGVSRILRRAEVDHPMYQRGLRRLQDSIDEFNKEVSNGVMI